MFNKRIKEIINNLRSDVYLKDELVECEKCGCLLRKETAIRGDSRIKEIASYKSMEYILPCNKDGIPIIPTKEVIHKDYYCKVHAPKKTKIK